MISVARERRYVAEPILTAKELEKVLRLDHFRLMRALKAERFAGAYFPFGNRYYGYRVPMAGVLGFAREMGMDEDIIRRRIDAVIAEREEEQ